MGNVVLSEFNGGKLGKLSSTVPSTTITRLKLTSSAIPFVAGIALATLLFILFGLDLLHHWVPYEPNKSPSSLGKLLPLFVWLAVVVAAAGVRWLRARRSRSWPGAQARIETGSVQSFSEGHGTFYRLTVGYWYSVKGERYGGVYVERFNRESDAQAMLRSLRDLPPLARYKPDDPSESVLTPRGNAARGTGLL
jgi:hypothetical protein